VERSRSYSSLEPRCVVRCNPVPKPPFIRGIPLEKKFSDLLAAVELCLHSGHTTPGLVLLYSGIDVASWVWSPNETAPVKQRFVKWVERYMRSSQTLGCKPLELYSARCAVVHNFGAESELTRKGSARKIIYAMDPSDPSIVEGPSVACLGFVGLGLKDLIAAFEKGLAAMFEQAKSDESLAKRLLARQAKVLQTVSDEDGRAMFEWGNRLVTVSRAPKRYVFDSAVGEECELENDCSAPATVVIRGIDKHGRALGEVYGCKAHAERWGAR
jgi:hypothetical protein